VNVYMRLSGFFSALLCAGRIGAAHATLGGDRASVDGDGARMGTVAAMRN